MDVSGTARLAAPPARVFDEVVDLGTYPGWLSIVRSAAPADPVPGDPGPAWTVELGARIGPFAKTKRVRMVLADRCAPKRARFERAETDDRPHSAWVLAATLEPEAEGAATTLRMDLHYGGAAWFPALDLVLGQEVRRAGGRLAARLAEAPPPQ